MSNDTSNQSVIPYTTPNTTSHRPIQASTRHRTKNMEKKASITKSPSPLVKIVTPADYSNPHPINVLTRHRIKLLETPPLKAKKTPEKSNIMYFCQKKIYDGCRCHDIHTKMSKE
jgi:hypothetical protein